MRLMSAERLAAKAGDGEFLLELVFVIRGCSACYVSLVCSTCYI